MNKFEVLYGNNKVLSVEETAQRFELNPKLCSAKVEGGFLVISEKKTPKIILSFWRERKAEKKV